ncbi:MAG: biopolymer transporter ExbD [Alphaproteobacteria bacterium]|nr:biopolymer transporter ExbD [Alphaproteobacteria bacterium]
MRFARLRRPDPIIDVSPMIDIVFQLVLFFMVSTTFVSAPGLEVELPRASTDEVLAERDDVSVWIGADGSVAVDEEPVDLAELRLRLRRAAERDRGTLVILKADQGVPHGRVVTVMDLARTLGLERIAIATEAGAGEAGGGEDEGP